MTAALAADHHRRHALLADLETVVVDTFKHHGYAHKVAARIAQKLIDFLSDLLARATGAPSKAMRRSEVLTDVQDHTRATLMKRGIAADIADAVAEKLADHLAGKWGGQVISWPMDYRAQEALAQIGGAK